MGKSETLIAVGILIIFLVVVILALNSSNLFKDFKNIQSSPQTGENSFLLSPNYVGECQAMTPSIDISPVDIERRDLGYTFSITITNNDLGCPAKNFTIARTECYTKPDSSGETCGFSGQPTYTVTPALNAGETRTLSGIFYMNARDPPIWKNVRFFSVIKAYPTTNPAQTVYETAIVYWQFLNSGGIRNPTITSPAGKSGTGNQTFN